MKKLKIEILKKALIMVIASIMLALIPETYSYAENEAFISANEVACWNNKGKDEQEMRLEYESVVGNVLAGIDESWTDIEKIFYLHDFICKNAEYAFDEYGNPDYRYGCAYSNLVEHRSICEGYANAFYVLANRAGIETYVVDSSELDHVWNMVVLNGKHYYIDCTWDDGDGPGGGYSFSNFLKSGEFLYHSHNKDDWELSWLYNNNMDHGEEINVFGQYNDDTEFDDVIWGSRFWKSGNNFFTAMEGCKISEIRGNIYKLSTDLSECELVKHLDGYWDGVVIGNTLFIFDMDKLYRYDEASNDFILVDSTASSRYLEFESLVDDTLNYKEYTENGTYVDKSLNVREYVGGKITLNKSFSILYNIGDETQLTATLNPNDGSVVSWESSNTSVATVDSNGKVKAIGYGAAWVKAISGDKQVMCLIAVPQIDIAEDEITVLKGSSPTGNINVSFTPFLFFTPWRIMTNMDSSNESIASISNENLSAPNEIFGMGSARFDVFAPNLGNASISISSRNGRVSDSTIVKVNSRVTRVNLTSSDGNNKANIYEDQSIQLSCTYEPIGAIGDKTITWSVWPNFGNINIDNNGLVSLSGNLVSTAADGSQTAMIQASIQGVESNSFELKIYNRPRDNTDFEDDSSGESDTAGEINQDIEDNGGNDYTGRDDNDKNDIENVDNNGDDSSKKKEAITMFRLYNPNSGEHFYTGSQIEKEFLVEVGWNFEGNGWEAPEYEGEPVYRLYNENAGDHHYTMSAAEKDLLVEAGWNYEGIAWNSAPAGTGKPLYRLYNKNAVSGSHHYTMSTGERDYLESVGWQYEGIAWYGL